MSTNYSVGMYRLPPQPLLAPVGYRIPLRGRAPAGPMGPLASRLGYPGAAGGRGRGRGRGRGKGKGRQRNRNKGGNKKETPAEPVTVEEEKSTAEVAENAGSEDKDDITDDNWQVISEETEETDSPQPAQQPVDNYVDFHSDMFDSDTAQGFSTFSEPVVVIANETEVPAAAPTEEVTTEEVADDSATGEEADVTVKEIITVEDAQASNEAQEVTILIDDDKPVSDQELTKEQSPAAKETKGSDKPSPSITTITAPRPSSPKDVSKKTPYGSFHCEVCNVYCYQQKHMKQHLAGRRHRTNVEAQGKGREIQNIVTSAAVTQKREAKKRERSESGGRQAGSEKKAKFVSEAEKKYKAYMKSAVTYPGLSDAMQEFFRHKEPLIGLKYGVEVGKSVDDPNPVYYCSICDDYFNSSIKLRHFTGTLHRKIVVKAEFPHKCSDQQPKDVDDADFYRNIARQVENEAGRQVHLIRRKVVTTDPISADGELLPKRKSDRTVKALLDLPPKEYLLEGPSHKAPLLEPLDRVVRVVPPSLKREREMGTWSPPPPAKRRSLLEPQERFADDIGFRNFDAPPDLLSGPLPHQMDIGLPARPPLLPAREELMDSRMFRQQGMNAPKPLLSLDLPPIMPGSSMGTARSSFSEQLRRMLDTMDALPIEELIRSEEDASISLHISNSLTKALLSFRMHSTSNVDRGELGSVYSMFSGGRY